MNKAKCNAEDYSNFIVASPVNYNCMEAGRVQTKGETVAAHDEYTRLLYRLEPDAAALGCESEPQVNKQQGTLILDNTTLDKPYAPQWRWGRAIWSGKHQVVVRLKLLWTDGERYLPCDYSLYEKANDGLSKNAYFCTLVQTAHELGFTPDCVAIDNWHSGLDNIKCLRRLNWH